MLQENVTISLPSRKSYAVVRSTANGRIADELIRYRYHLAAVENGLVRDIMRLFKQTALELNRLFDERNPLLLSNLSAARAYSYGEPIKSTDEVAVPLSARSMTDASATGKHPLTLAGIASTTKLIMSVVGQLIDTMLDKIDRMVFAAQLELADVAPRILARIVNSVLPVGIRITTQQKTTDKLLRNYLIETPVTEAIGGKNRKALQRHYGKAFTKMERFIMQGFINGLSTRTIANNVRGVVRKDLAGAAARLARTELQRLAAEAEGLLYDQSRDIVKEETWLAALDVLTCLQCGYLDGRTFAVGAGPVPVKDTHPHCRCVRSPVVKSWEELGVDPSVLPEKARRQLTGRAPERVTWRRWFVRQPEKVKREILGKTRYSLYKTGKLDVDDFATNRRVLTVKQLKKKYKIK